MKFLLLILILNTSFSNENLISVKQVRELVPKCTLTITSAHRSAKHNKKVGGSKNSYHLYGRALDIVSTKSCLDKLKTRALSAGLTVIVYKNHIHIDNRDIQKCLVKAKQGFKKCTE